jgi:hypothetical protein
LGSALGAALALVFVAACGAFGSASTGGDPVATSTDAAVDGADTDDAAARPMADDAGRPEDAGGDAGKSTDAGADASAKPPKPCSVGNLCTAPEFCCAEQNSGTSWTCRGETDCPARKYLCAPDAKGGSGCPGARACLSDGVCAP